MSCSICADCTKGANECSFMADMIPIPGWTAKKVKYRRQVGEPVDTYHVIDCPEFNEMKKVEAKRKMRARRKRK